MKSVIRSLAPSQRQRHWVALAAVAAVSFALTGCGSSDAGSSSGRGSVDLDALKAEIAKFSAKPEATPPGPAFDAKKAVGKSVWTIPTASSVPVIKLENDALSDAFGRVGVKVRHYSTDGSPNSWVQAMNQAIGQGADAIILEGIDPKLIAPQLAAAKKANIKVVWDWAVPGSVSDVAPEVTATNPLQYDIKGKLLADLSALQTKGKAKAHIYNLESQRQDSIYIDAFKKELSQVCSSCSLEATSNVPIPNWSDALTSEARNLMSRKQDVNVLIPLYDGMAGFVEPAVRQVNAAGSVRIITQDGTPSVLDLIRKGDIVTADIGEDRTWQAWGAADQTLRLLAGVEPVADEKIPVRVWTKDNISEATGPNAEDGYGTSYVPMYEKLWGLSS
jgi:ribose transport system substrate-binding protein